MKKEGADAWLSSPPERFLGNTYKAEDWNQVTGISQSIRPGIRVVPGRATTRAPAGTAPAMAAAALAPERSARAACA